MAEQTEKQKAAEKRRQAEDGFTEEEHKQEYLSALAVERLGYVQRGKSDRVDAVDAEIRRVKGARAPKSIEA